MTKKIKAKTRVTIAMIMPDHRIFWQAQVLIAIFVAILSIIIQTLGVILEKIASFNFSWRAFLDDGLPFSWVLVIAPVILVLTGTIIHGYTAVLPKSWRITGSSLIRKKTVVRRHFEIESIKPGWGCLVLYTYDGSYVLMIYIRDSQRIAKIIEKAKRELLKKYESETNV